MTVTQVSYTGDGVKQDYVVTFPYLRRSDVVVTVDAVEAAFTWQDATTIIITTVPPNLSAISIARDTDISVPFVDFEAGSTLTEEDHDNNTLQLLYALQEVPSLDAAGSAAAAAASAAAAAASAAAAAASAAAAQASADAAAASAAGVNLPSIQSGDAGKQLYVKGDETGYELLAPPSTTGTITGEVKGWAGGTIPSGWLECNGQEIDRTSFADLFSAIGTTYGAGNGSTTFNVPDFRGRSVIGAGTGSGLTARSSGQTGGAETHLLTESEIPGHTHAPGTLTAAASGNTTADILATSGDTVTSTGGGGPNSESVTVSDGNDASTQWSASLPDHTHTISGASASTGGDGAHENMPPFGVLKWMIKT